MATTDLGLDDVTLHRVETFLALGFQHDEAFELAEARGLDGFRLSHHDVERYMVQGATHAHIMRIFAA
jgi:hypothetical protein